MSEVHQSPRCLAGSRTRPADCPSNLEKMSMSWSPITEDEIIEMIRVSEEMMSVEERRLWNLVRVDLQKWNEVSSGNEGGGFWIVAILGQTVIWYNDIEEGFNISNYSRHGEIKDYWCNQDELNWVIKRLLDHVNGDGSLG
ncbi:hypothetical protein [Zavarzinia sp. CC-PAN008]|uniref:hypothetical protein n=1 Tax=Zavarzinia sp. CC-PAN008 TaxID=3243332 RepID=UPI003F748350